MARVGAQHKIKDMTGKRFGRLVVLNRAENRRVGKAQKPAVFWNCRCDCNREKEIMGGSLKSGAVLSCGCLHSEKSIDVGKSKLIDISGERFGKLTVLKRAPNRGTKIYWLVRCDCGSDSYETESLKLRNVRRQCPTCSRNDSVVDLTGFRYGKWKVIRRANNKDTKRRGSRWLAQCDCGSEPQAFRQDYFKGPNAAKDCGCGYIKGKQDIVGRKFNKLTVLKWLEHTTYECKCDCGNIVVRPRSSLLSDVKSACHDCNRKAMSLRRSVEITGQHFGMWTVIKRIHSVGEVDAPLWLCKCECGNTRAHGAGSLMAGHSKSCGCNMPKGDKHHNYIGGKDYGRFTYYKVQFSGIEEFRRDPLNKKAIQVKCTLCNRWFSPTQRQCKERVAFINGKSYANESRFYCSDECKAQCSIYGQHKYPKGFKTLNYHNEVVDPDLNTLVLNRDSYQCQKCGACTELEVHHIEGVAQEPMLANDLDNCITVCHSCHKAIHAQPGCSYHDYQREACEDSKGAVINQ